MSILKIKDSSGNWIPIPAIKGEPGDDYVLTAADKAEIAGLLIDDTATGDTDKTWSSDKIESELDNKISDVQINGTSVVDAQGNANIPVASSSRLGAVRPSYSGIQANSDGQLFTKKATSSQVKDASNDYDVIVPSNQDQSVFYGLAKAAGSDEKNSTLPVGQYTDAAKVAIQKMLGVYQPPWELIREETFTNAEEADHDIAVDSLGQSFELTDVILLFETPVQENEAKFGSTGVIWAYVNNSNRTTYKVECGGYTQAANATAHGCAMVIRNSLSMFEMYRVAQTTSSNTGVVGMRYGTGFAIDTATQDRVMFKLASIPITVNKIRISAVTGTGHYYLYGRRKWQQKGRYKS